MLVEYQRVGLEHRLEPLAGTTSLVAHFGELCEVFGHQGCGGVQGGVAHRAAVRLDRLVPQPRHLLTIRDGGSATLRLDRDIVSRSPWRSQASTSNQGLADG